MCTKGFVPSDCVRARSKLEEKGGKNKGPPEGEAETNTSIESLIKDIVHAVAEEHGFEKTALATNWICLNEETPNETEQVKTKHEDVYEATRVKGQVNRKQTYNRSEPKPIRCQTN